jgi:hypothetical protein
MICLDGSKIDPIMVFQNDHHYWDDLIIILLHDSARWAQQMMSSGTLYAICCHPNGFRIHSEFFTSAWSLYVSTHNTITRAGPNK